MRRRRFFADIVEFESRPTLPLAGSCGTQQFKTFGLPTLTIGIGFLDGAMLPYSCRNPHSDGRKKELGHLPEVTNSAGYLRVARWQPPRFSGRFFDGSVLA